VEQQCLNSSGTSKICQYKETYIKRLSTYVTSPCKNTYTGIAYSRSHIIAIMTINSLSDVNVSLADETLMHVMMECPEALDE